MIFWLLWPILAYLQQWLVTPLQGVPWAAALGALLGLWSWHHKLSLKLWPALALLLWILLEIGRSSPLNNWGILAMQALEAGGFALLLVWALRSASSRHSALGLLELGWVGKIFVTLLEGHRQGFINRPFAWVDPLWLRGTDPIWLFIGTGCLALSCSVVIAHQQDSQRGRPWWDLPLLLLLVSSLWLLLPNYPPAQIFEKFGMGTQPGDDNRLTPEGSSSPSPSSGQEQGKGKSSSQPKSEFADTPPPPPQPKVVAVVVFEDDYEPPSGAYYFRQTSQSLYNGRNLVHDDTDLDVATSFPTVARPAPAQTLGMKLPAYQERHFQPVTSRVALLTQHIRPFGLDQATGYWSCSNPDPSRFQKAYEVQSLAFSAEYVELIPTPAGQPDWSPATWKHYLEGPSDPRYRQLAEQILSGLTPERRNSALFRAVAIKQWLDQNCTYSLKSPSSQAADPVSHFLFGERVGYCVFTSHAAAYLYRAAGVPARISKGYAVNAQQRGNGSSLLIRDSDAHSWPEICLSEVGWLEIDVSPAKNLEPEKEQVDAGLQQMLGDMARKEKDAPRPEQDRKSWDWRGWIWNLLRLAPYLVLVGLALLWSAKIWRRLTAHRDLHRAHFLVLELLAEQGITRLPHESREALGRRLQDTHPDLAPLIRMHLRGRLGDRPTQPPEFAALLQRCRQQIAAQSKGWRAYFGWLDPSSGWRVR